MSYEHIEYYHKITFRSETDYHLCKIEYLRSESTYSFSFFVERSLYSHNRNIIVENIEHLEPQLTNHHAGVDTATGNSLSVESTWQQSSGEWSLLESSIVNQDQFIVHNYDFADMGIPLGLITTETEKAVPKKRKKLSRFDILDIKE